MGMYNYYKIRKFTCAFSKLKKYETTQSQKKLEHHIYVILKETGDLTVNKYNEKKTKVHRR
jgi:hypothetical protein